MIRIGVCDDIPFYVEALSSAIEIWASRKHLHVQLKKFLSGEEVLWEVEQTGEFTAFFLDVELTGMSGVELAAGLRERDKYANIVFVTQYDSYFRQMFALHPCYFLEKPICRKQLSDILDRILDEKRYLYATFQFPYKRMIYNISLRKVLYFTSEKRMIRIIMENRTEYVFYCKLDDLEQRISEYGMKFLRIHKSFLVNSGQVEQYHPSYVMMSSKERLPVSRECKERVARYRMKLLEEM